MRTQVSLLAAAALAAAVSGSFGASTARPAAVNLCYSATVTTAVTGTKTVPLVCIPYGGPAVCGPTGTGLGSLFTVSVQTCVPSPTGSRVSTAGA